MCVCACVRACLCVRLSLSLSLYTRIESNDCKRQKAVDAAKSAAAAPLSPWALKLQEEQKAFAAAMANMQPEDDEL